MFFRLFQYNLLRSVRMKEILFWSLIFPIGLGTFFQVTFGHYMEKEEIFTEIPVAYVEEADADASFGELLDTMEEGDDALIAVTDTSMEDAKQLLEEKEVSGIYYNSGEEVTLYVKEEGIKPSILQAVLQEYEQTKQTITTIAGVNPMLVEQAVQAAGQSVDMIVDEKYTGADMDQFVNYFYALLAMTSLYGCFLGVNCAVDIKADQSAIGARRIIASSSRCVGILADVAASLLIQFVCSIVGFVYLKYILGVRFGSRIPQLLLVLLVASFIGVASGFFFGSLGKRSRDSKIGIVVALTMLECFLSGLMVGNMYHIVQEHCPVINKINPAALIVDALYSLDIYDDYTRYTENLVILLGIAVLLCIGSFLAVRRERYASL